MDRRRRAVVVAVVRADLIDHSRMARARGSAGESGRRNASSAAAAAHDREGVTSIGIGKAHHRVAAAAATCTSSLLLRDRREVESETWSVREEDRTVRHGERGIADGGSLEVRGVLLRSDAADCDSSNDRDACRAVGISRMVYASAANPGNPLLLGGNRHRRLDHRTEEDLVCQVATDCDSWPPKSLST